MIDILEAHDATPEEIEKLSKKVDETNSEFKEYTNNEIKNIKSYIHSTRHGLNTMRDSLDELSELRQALDNAISELDKTSELFSEFGAGDDGTAKYPDNKIKEIGEHLHNTKQNITYIDDKMSKQKEAEVLYDKTGSKMIELDLTEPESEIVASKMLNLTDRETETASKILSTTKTESEIPDLTDDELREIKRKTQRELAEIEVKKDLRKRTLRLVVAIAMLALLLVGMTFVKALRGTDSTKISNTESGSSDEYIVDTE